MEWGIKRRVEKMCKLHLLLNSMLIFDLASHVPRVDTTKKESNEEFSLFAFQLRCSATTFHLQFAYSIFIVLFSIYSNVGSEFFVIFVTSETGQVCIRKLCQREWRTFNKKLEKKEKWAILYVILAHHRMKMRKWNWKKWEEKSVNAEKEWKKTVYVYQKLCL